MKCDLINRTQTWEPQAHNSAWRHWVLKNQVLLALRDEDETASRGLTTQRPSTVSSLSVSSLSVISETTVSSCPSVSYGEIHSQNSPVSTLVDTK